MTTRHLEINRDLLSNLRCYLAPKKHWKRNKIDTDSFDISADSGSSSCATPDEIDFMPGAYKHLTEVATNGIAEGLKVTGCRSVCWIFQYNKKENIEIIIEQVLHIPGLPIRLVFQQKIAKQTGHIGDVSPEEED